MQRRVDEAGASGTIEARLQDFLEVDPTDKHYSKVTAILLDPSCSGSGIVSTPDRIHENQGGVEGADGQGDGAARIERLAAFQLAGLLKAMSFPQARVIIIFFNVYMYTVCGTVSRRYNVARSLTT